jgi:hypothetical protein
MGSSYEGDQLLRAGIGGGLNDRLGNGAPLGNPQSTRIPTFPTCGYE